MQITADNVKAIAYGTAALVAGFAIYKLFKFGKVAVDKATAVPRAALKYFTDPAERKRVADLYGVKEDDPVDDFDGWSPYV